MGKQDLSGLRIYTRRIGLKAADSSEGVSYGHRHQRRDISLTAGRNALCIEKGKSQTACISDRIQKVKASQGQSGKFMSGNDGLQCLVYAECAVSILMKG